METDYEAFLKTALDDLFGLSVNTASTQEVESLIPRGDRLFCAEQLPAANVLMEWMISVKEGESILLTDYLCFQWLVCHVFDQIILVGPFTTLRLSEKECREMFSGYGWAEQNARNFWHYQFEKPLCTLDTILRIISLIAHISGHDPMVQLTPIDLIETKKDQNAKQTGHFNKYVNHGYDNVKQYLQAVEAGDSVAALATLEKLKSKHVGKSEKNPEDVIQSHVGFGIVRAQGRIAAMNANVPDYEIHQLCSLFSEKAMKANMPQDALALSSQFTVEMCDLVKRYKTLNLPEFSANVIAYIQLNLHQTPTASKVAEHFGITSGSLANRFHKETGCSVTDYIKKLKMEKAKHMLAQKNVTIEEICSAVSIPDQSYMIKVFKQVEGVTPGEYRRSITK